MPRSFFDRAADLAQVLTKRIAGLLSAAAEVFSKFQLIGKSFTLCNSPGLAHFRFGDVRGTH
jgi:hypothetical protein